MITSLVTRWSLTWDVKPRSMWAREGALIRLHQYTQQLHSFQLHHKPEWLTDLSEVLQVSVGRHMDVWHGGSVIGMVASQKGLRPWDLSVLTFSLPPSLPTRKTLRDDIMYTKHFSSPECVSYIHFPTLVWSPTCKLHLKIRFYLPPLFHHRNVWRSTVLFHRRGYGPNLVLGWSRYF